MNAKIDVKSLRYILIVGTDLCEKKTLRSLCTAEEEIANGVTKGSVNKMPTKAEMIKGLDALDFLIKEQEQLRRDGLIFIFDNGLWEKFMLYHSEQHLRRAMDK